MKDAKVLLEKLMKKAAQATAGGNHQSKKLGSKNNKLQWKDGGESDDFRMQGKESSVIMLIGLGKSNLCLTF
ncbi:hypothetical protein ERO13_A03G093450v2 [Gossypium hirsutum]|nr:hypothetical protein ERO13_A03G093450v2 [Gossypium hirsutum]